MSDRVREIEPRVNAATEGPWFQGDEVNLCTVWMGRWHGLIARTDEGHPDFPHAADAEFIAHAREDVPWLLAELREAREALRDAQEISRDGEGTDLTRCARIDQRIALVLPAEAPRG